MADSAKRISDSGQSSAAEAAPGGFIQDRATREKPVRLRETMEKRITVEHSNREQITFLWVPGSRRKKKKKRAASGTEGES